MLLRLVALTQYLVLEVLLLVLLGGGLAGGAWLGFIAPDIQPTIWVPKMERQYVVLLGAGGGFLVALVLAVLIFGPFILFNDIAKSLRAIEKKVAQQQTAAEHEGRASCDP